MTYYKNNLNVSLMMWEQVPELRNKNNVVKLNHKTRVDLKVGDVVVCNPTGTTTSSYEIIKFISSRPSSLIGYTYSEALVKWDRRPTQEVLDSWKEGVS